MLDLSALKPPVPEERAAVASGVPLHLPLEKLQEDPDNPRTEFIEAELRDLADDIAERGILQPIVVAPVDAAGRYLIRFGAKRFRAARLAGLATVPVVVSHAPSDGYAQVAENLKRHGLTPLDLAKFMQRRVEAGDSNATIAKRLVVDLTTVAHHLALLRLPPPVDAVFRTGRCTSPRTLYELAKLHEEHPARAATLMGDSGELTRKTVAAARQPHEGEKRAPARPHAAGASSGDEAAVKATADWIEATFKQLGHLMDALMASRANGDTAAAQVLERLHAGLSDLLQR